MKKLFKIVLYIVLALFMLILLLTVVAKISENKISKMVLVRVSERFQAPVTIDNVSFNLLRKFPLATIELNEVYLGSPTSKNAQDSSLQASDTILKIHSIYFSVKSRPLLDGEFEIIKIEIDGADINYSLDSLGASNIDFLMDTAQTTETDTTVSTPLKLTLKELTIKNTSCNYNDLGLKVAAHIFIPEMKIKAKALDDKYSASVKGIIELSKCAFDSTNLGLMNLTKVKLDVDYENDLAVINKFNIVTDGAELNVTGTALVKDTITTDLKISGQQINLGELVKYAPNGMLNEFGVIKLEGIINFDGTVKGMYADSLLPQVTMSIAMKEGGVVTKDYPALKNILLEAQITNGILCNNQSTQIDIKSLGFELGQSKFNLALSLLDIDHPKYDIKTNMQINIADFKQFIPDSLVKNIDGTINASFTTKGVLPDSIGDDFTDYIMARSTANIELSSFNIEMDSSLSITDLSVKMAYKPNSFKVDDLRISVPTYHVNLKNSSFDAKFTGSPMQINSMVLDLKSFHIETDSSLISGSAFVKNFDKPVYSIITHFDLNLADLQTMMPDSIVKTMKGQVIADITSSGIINLDSIAEQTNDLVFESSSFKIGFNKVCVEMPDDSLMKIENFTGNVSMKPDTITINKTSGVFSGIDFSVDSTTIVNVYNTVIKNLPEQLLVQGNIHLGDLDYAMLGAFMTTDTTALVPDSTTAIAANVEQKPVTAVSEPDSIAVTDTASVNYTFLMKGKFSVASITYGKVLIENISAKFKLTDSVYRIEDLKLNAFKGTMNNSIKMAIKADGRTVIETHNIINGMDVKQLLKDFDNFGDTSLTSENISGIFSTDLFTRVPMHGDSILYNDIRIKGDLKLEDGGVYNYQPAKDLAKFTNINELDNIQFKTLESSIFMFKNKIYVPKTHIVSTAIDITAFGMQSLGEDYEYHIQLNLGDVLKGKSKKLLQEQASGGDKVSDDDADRNAVKLIYALNDGKSKVGFDTKKLQSAMLNKIRVQEKMLDLIFNPRLVSFDTGVK